MEYPSKIIPTYVERYFKDFNDVNEAEKVAHDRYFEAVRALGSAEEMRFHASDERYKHIGDRGAAPL